MKTLKNKIFAGALTLASFGFFGEKNLMAQDADSLSIKISFECLDDNRKKVPCFEEKDVLLRGILTHYIHKSLKDITNFVIISYTKEQKKLKMGVVNTMQVENFKGESLGCSGKHSEEIFEIDYDSKLINYKMNTAEHDPQYKTDSILYSEKNLTKQDIYNKFGENFMERTKEIINAEKDSLSLANLLKKEYKRWRFLEDGNGERYEITPLNHFIK